MYMVEIIPREPKKLSTGLNILFYLAIFLLFFSVISYFVLNSLLKKAEAKIIVLELDLTREMPPEKISLEKEILADKNKIDDFSYLIEQHLEVSRIFEIIQKTTHPQVWFSKFDLNSRQGALKIFGETQNFETLGQQILILRGEAAVNKVNLEKVSIGKEGKINFDLSLFFNPDIFR